MAKVLGVGGVFFKSQNPRGLYEWYAKWLHMEFEDWGIAYFPKDMPANSQTVWSVFEATSTYFDPSEKGFMFNLIVDDLEEALRQVQEGGARVSGKIEEMEFGRFGWFIDPDGNKVELWEPTKE
jgi:predicted enzyme related to lactoylglutathione lyase